MTVIVLAIALGAIGVVVKGLLYLTVIAALVFAVSLLVWGYAEGRHTDTKRD